MIYEEKLKRYHFNKEGHAIFCRTFTAFLKVSWNLTNNVSCVFIYKINKGNKMYTFTQPTHHSVLLSFIYLFMFQVYCSIYLYFFYFIYFIL